MLAAGDIRREAGRERSAGEPGPHQGATSQAKRAAERTKSGNDPRQERTIGTDDWRISIIG
jgi:hypothetical protein